MKNIILIKPSLKNYYYEAKINNDPNTMNYNAGYDVYYDGYNYDTGCITFPKEKWKDKYNERKNKNDYFFAYIKDVNKNRFIGYANYHYNESKHYYECSILIEYKYRHKGYGKDALRLLIKEAYSNNIKYLYDSFEEDRLDSLLLFKKVGFEVDQKTTWKRFGKKVRGLILKIDTSKVLPDISKVKTIEDVLLFMKDNIRYGWQDINKKIHIGNMKEFRRLYKTLSIEQILNLGIGTCIDQVNLMHYLLNKLNIKNKMFATRIYEPRDFNNLEEDEHMHCFILAYQNNKVYHIEHPNWYRIGIYEYSNEIEAINTINNYYIKLSKGIPRPVTEFYKILDNISFKEFNCYINDLDISFRDLVDCKADYELLYKWCQNKFVYEWFEQRILSYEEIVKKYKKKIKENIQELLIIESDNNDIGLVQIYKYDESRVKYNNVYEYDIFIGEEDYLNKGLGKKAIDNINNYIYKKYHVDAIVLRPFKRNIRAINCYLKCDFKHIRDYNGFDTLNNPEVISVLLKECTNENS